MALEEPEDLEGLEQEDLVHLWQVVLAAFVQVGHEGAVVLVCQLVVVEDVP